MYSIQVKTEINLVKPSFWELNQPTYSSLYRTLDYLRDSQVRLGDIPLFYEVYENDRPAALFPIVLFTRQSDYPPVDPHLIISKALGRTSLIEEPVAMCVTFFGLGCPVSINGSIDWEEVLQLVKSNLYENYKVNYLAICYQSPVDDPFLNYSFTDTHLIKIPHKEFGLLDLRKYTSYEDYFSRLSPKMRQSYRAEQRLGMKNNVVIQRETVSSQNTESLGHLAAEVYRKYGNEVDPVRLKTFAENTTASYPENTGFFTAYKNSSLLSYSMYILNNNVLHMKMFGRSYELDHYQSYFMVVYQAPIQFAFQKGLDFIDYGGGSGNTKKRRGIDLLMSYAYVV
ncbi:peptidogalycan biosysnthesis protein [Paenibacillus silvae]|uniref:peptidogalycan biosysnthesis protein n=1 Tax=Paenibacillus silvae TaxID=1325358 RepID=UPI0020061D07|nr:peptidogalycan biosysnthesis protein [Paenibacillus silvae]MCK6076579.1 N-acetyltransferase [Paenibacillus silvae]MCK6151006.1 N-acetyltransferase [Paenibacillus silvae]MCK6269266.1 N-acetyltransferase [Paenibacillus silvae]